MIKLQIKGPRKTAQRMAARHGVPVQHCKTHNQIGSRKGGYTGAATNCDAPCSSQRNVMHWYGARHTKREGRGLTPGTLLFFAAGRCDSSLGGARSRGRLVKKVIVTRGGSMKSPSGKPLKWSQISPKARFVHLSRR